MQIILISGLSGAGKSVALHMLEDLGYYCIDNMPAALLKAFIAHTVRSSEKIYQRTAVSLDARNSDAEIASVPTLIDELKRSGIDCEVLFLTADDDELLRRFAETRRVHPLSRQGETLREAIASERRLLEPIAQVAEQVIDTSSMGVHQLRDLIGRRVDPRAPERLSLQFESFGFKHGIPGDADFVFDARSLPNPYWESALRPLTGLDAPVARFLDDQPSVHEFIADVVRFMNARIPDYRASARRYLTVAIGCTGGQHRSVYIVERLAEVFGSSLPGVRVRHSALAQSSAPAAELRPAVRSA
jgi:RNase adapter protein RapZ